MERVSYFDLLASSLKCSLHNTTPTNGSQVTEGEGVQAAYPLAHARRRLLQSTTWSSAWLGLGRYLPALREPLREMLGAWGMVAMERAEVRER